MKHPFLNLPEEIIHSLRKSVAEAERQGQLTAEQLQLIYRQRWFRLFVPEEYDGLNLSLPDAVRLEENIAYADGSVGWVVTLCAGAAMFIGYFDQELAKEVFSQPQACLAGSGQVNGIAEMIEGGFEVTGTWPYSSGAPHATHFTANCMIKKDGRLLSGPDGQPLSQSFIFTKEEVVLHHNWNYLGLNATAGHAYTVEKIKIPANRTFIIDAQHAQLPSPVYRYPFLQLAETTIAANISGMCLYFFDLARQLLSEKQTHHSVSVNTTGLEKIADITLAMQSLRKEFYDALDNSWSMLIRDGKIDTDALLAVTAASRQLASHSRNWVNLVYPYCGLLAARTDTVINQVWRNINTASQHSLLNRS